MTGTEYAQNNIIFLNIGNFKKLRHKETKKKSVRHQKRTIRKWREPAGGYVLDVKKKNDSQMRELHITLLLKATWALPEAC